GDRIVIDASRSGITRRTACSDSPIVPAISVAGCPSTDLDVVWPSVIGCWYPPAPRNSTEVTPAGRPWAHDATIPGRITAFVTGVPQSTVPCTQAVGTSTASPWNTTRA